MCIYKTVHNKLLAFPSSHNNLFIKKQTYQRNYSSQHQAAVHILPASTSFDSSFGWFSTSFQIETAKNRFINLKWRMIGYLNMC
jgi:hypothetical protein